jgi:hypothetical protein
MNATDVFTPTYAPTPTSDNSSIWLIIVPMVMLQLGTLILQILSHYKSSDCCGGHFELNTPETTLPVTVAPTATK